MNTIVVLVFLIVWTLPFLCIGIPDLFMMLGGSAVLYLLLPVILFICRIDEISNKLFWGILLTLFGLILTNYLYSYFLHNYKQFPLFAGAYIVVIPASCIMIGFLFTFQSFLMTPREAKVERKEHADSFRYFWGFFMAVFLLPLLCPIPFLVGFPELRNITSIGYEIALGGLIVGCLIFLFESRQIPVETLIYFARPLRRFDTDTRKLRKRLMIYILICMCWSAGKEFLYRQQWVICGETLILFIIYVIFLNKFSRVLFLPAIFSSDKPSRICLPSIKSKRGRVIVELMFIALFVLAFIAITR